MRIDIDGDNIKIEMQVEAGEGIECRYEGKFPASNQRKLG